MHSIRLRSASIAVTGLKSMQSFSTKVRRMGIVSHNRSFDHQNTSSHTNFARFVQLPKESDWLENLKDFVLENFYMLFLF